MSAPASYTLKHAIARTLRNQEGEEREEVLLSAGHDVPLRRIKAKDLRCTDDHAGEVAKAIALVAKITGLEISAVDAMDVEDLAGLQERLEGFLPPGLLTGATS